MSPFAIRRLSWGDDAARRVPAKLSLDITAESNAQARFRGFIVGIGRIATMKRPLRRSDRRTPVGSRPKGGLDR